MALQTVLEKLQLNDEKNILVQGLPSSIEKQFLKLSFAKSVTPLLKSRRIDFALVFAVSKTQLTGIMKDVIPALHENAKLWIAHPKVTSKIASDLCRDCTWEVVKSMGFETVEFVELDNTWNAVNFKQAVAATAPVVKKEKKSLVTLGEYQPVKISKELNTAFSTKSKRTAAV